MPTTTRGKTRPRRRLRNPHVVPILVCTGLIAFAAAPSALAHVTLSPAFVERGVRTTVRFETPNEREGRATTSLRLEAPPGIELGTARAPTGWELEVTGGTATWSGGRIAGEAVVAFPLEVTAGTGAGLQTFRAVQGYDDGESVRWETTLTVLPEPAEEAPSQRLGRALVAGAVGLVVIGVSLLVLWRARRRSLQER
jgi:uncharacterized protein YcnI